MTAEPPPDRAERFEPRAHRAMADMFDDVSSRYDLLNRLMTLGRDRAWRARLWEAVPDEARTVLDLCTGNGASLPGLRRPGRLVLGIDVAFGMLGIASSQQGRTGWAPRLVCGDAFRLPLRAGALDAVTLAFGMRNLRPRGAALGELARALRPGGVLAVLEATAPAPGPFAPLHRLWLKRVVPLLGRLSPDPSAYRYLAESIFEFGAGPELEADLERAGFSVTERRSFLLGAAGLWVAERGRPAGEAPAGAAAAVQDATGWGSRRGGLPQAADPRDQEWRIWTGFSLVTSAALTAALAYGCWVYFNSRASLPLDPWQEKGLEVLLVGGALAFAARTVLLLLRFAGPRDRR
jgi:demethylmenaquinone methyltransferase/2-methoxy-6-polyprenyl-1,4-benzoquinol methylase